MEYRRQANFAGFLGETFALVVETIVPALAVVAIVAAVAFAGEMAGLVDSDDPFASLGFGFVVNGSDDLGALLFRIGSAVVTIVASYFYLARLLVARRALGEGGTRIWAYVGLSIISGLGMMLGFLFLIIPGLVLLCRWSAASGFLLGDRTEVTESLEKSWSATKGHAWQIFFAGLVLFGGYLFLAVLIGGVAGVWSSETAVSALTALVEGVGTAFPLAFGIAIYVLVHDRAGSLSAVFE